MTHLIKIAGLSAVLATAVTFSDLSIPAAATGAGSRGTGAENGADVIAGLRCDGPGWPYVGSVCTSGQDRAIRTVGLDRKADGSGEKRVAEVVPAIR